MVSGLKCFAQTTVYGVILKPSRPACRLIKLHQRERSLLFFGKVKKDILVGSLFPSSISYSRDGQFGTAQHLPLLFREVILRVGLSRSSTGGFLA